MREPGIINNSAVASQSWRCHPPLVSGGCGVGIGCGLVDVEALIRYLRYVELVSNGMEHMSYVHSTVEVLSAKHGQAPTSYDVAFEHVS